MEFNKPMAVIFLVVALYVFIFMYISLYPYLRFPEPYSYINVLFPIIGISLIVYVAYKRWKGED